MRTLQPIMETFLLHKLGNPKKHDCVLNIESSKIYLILEYKLT